MFFKRIPHRILLDTTINEHQVVIRYLHPSDVKPLHRYINELSQERTYITFQGDMISLQEEEKHVKDVMVAIEQKREVKLVLVVDDVLSGSTEVILESRITAHRGNLGLSIAKQVRGMGLGELFLRTVIEEAKRVLPGLRIIQLTCFATNKPALSLYKKVGFEERGRIPGAIFYNGEYLDELILTLEIT